MPFGMEILYNPDWYQREGEKPNIKRAGKVRNPACTIKWGIEIITSKRNIRIFMQ